MPVLTHPPDATRVPRSKSLNSLPRLFGGRRKLLIGSMLRFGGLVCSWRSRCVGRPARVHPIIRSTSRCALPFSKRVFFMSCLTCLRRHFPAWVTAGTQLEPLASLLSQSAPLNMAAQPSHDPFTLVQPHSSSKMSSLVSSP